MQALNIKILQPFKNYKKEWVFPKENLESENFTLFLKEGDLTPLLFFINDFYNSYEIRPCKVFLPFFPDNQNRFLYDIVDGIRRYIRNFTAEMVIYLFDNYSLDTEWVSENDYECKEDIKGIMVYNVIPDWTPYIDKDSAVLFLNDEYKKKYNIIGRKYCTLKDFEGIWDKFAITIPELHTENVTEINNIAKKLKEEYGVERVELFVSHCFIEEWLEFLRWQLNQDEDGGLNYSDYNDIKNIYIDKITTTNSTGVLEVQDTEKLKVINSVEFFEKSLQV